MKNPTPKRRILFPDPRQAGPDGIVAVGGDFASDTLFTAYSQGIFPWPHEDYSFLWFCPEQRGILYFDELHIPKSLEKARRENEITGKYTITIDKAFTEVVKACSQVKRPNQKGTWITPEIIAGYEQFHKEGHAHSIEVWRSSDSGHGISKRVTGTQLVGGLYGVSVKGTFAGESMFHTEPNTSKLALLYLIDYLKEKGLPWMDIQQVTPHMQALGARAITRDEFLIQLEQLQKRNLALF